MDSYSNTIINDLYIMVKYFSWDLNDPKKRINYMCYPINSVIFNFEDLKRIKICKKTHKIINEDDINVITNMFRFSEGPFYFEKPTNIYINNKMYFSELNFKNLNKYNFMMFEN